MTCDQHSLDNATDLLDKQSEIPRPQNSASENLRKHHSERWRLQARTGFGGTMNSTSPEDRASCDPSSSP